VKFSRKAVRNTKQPPRVPIGLLCRIRIGLLFSLTLCVDAATTEGRESREGVGVRVEAGGGEEGREKRTTRAIPQK